MPLMGPGVTLAGRQLVAASRTPVDVSECEMYSVYLEPGACTTCLGLLHSSVQTEPATMDASEQTEMAGADGNVTALRWTHVLIADAVGEAVAEAVGCDINVIYQRWDRLSIC